MALHEVERGLYNPDRLPPDIAYRYLSFLLGEKQARAIRRESTTSITILLTRDQEEYTGEPCINMLVLQRDMVSGKIVAGEEDIIDKFGQGTRLRTLEDQPIIALPERRVAGRYMNGYEDQEYALACGITFASFAHNFQQVTSRP